MLRYKQAEQQINFYIFCQFDSLLFALQSMHPDDRWKPYLLANEKATDGITTWKKSWINTIFDGKFSRPPAPPTFFSLWCGARINNWPHSLWNSWNTEQQTLTDYYRTIPEVNSLRTRPANNLLMYMYSSATRIYCNVLQNTLKVQGQTIKNDSLEATVHFSMRNTKTRLN